MHRPDPGRRVPAVGETVSIYDNLSGAERKRAAENAERIRRVVPPGERQSRTGIVNMLAVFMLFNQVEQDQIRVAFHAMAWLEERT